MSWCEASVIAGQNVKEIQVTFSSDAEFSYICESAAIDLQLSQTPTDTFTIADAYGEQFICTKTSSIELVLGTFHHLVVVLVVPGDLEVLVLGTDWLTRYNAHHDLRQKTISITDESGTGRTIHLSKDGPAMGLVPSMRIISRVLESDNKPNRPISRYKMIKDNWGNRHRFQASFGLSMEPEDIEEGNRILAALEEADE